MVLMFDVEIAGGISFRGIADEDLTIVEFTRLAPGQTLPVSRPDPKPSGVRGELT